MPRLRDFVWTRKQDSNSNSSDYSEENEGTAPGGARETTIPEFYPELKMENVHNVVWGEAAGGLEAGIAYFATDRRTYRVGDLLPIVITLRNVSDDPVQISHSIARLRFVRPEIEDSGGRRLDIDMPPTVRYGPSGVFPTMEVSLKPGEEIAFDLVKINLAAGSARRAGIPHVDVPPGEYTISYAVRLEAPTPLQTGELRFVVAEIQFPHPEDGADLALAVNPDETVLGENIRVQRLERVATFVTSVDGHNELRVRRDKGTSVTIRPGGVSDIALIPLHELVTSVVYEAHEQTREIRTRQAFDYLFVAWPESGPITWMAYREAVIDRTAHVGSEEDILAALPPEVARTDTVGLLEGSEYLPMVLQHRVHELRLEHVVTLVGSLKGQEAVRVPTERGFIVLRPGEARLMELNRPVDSTAWYDGDERKELRAREPFNYLLAMRPESGRITWAAYRSPKVPTQLEDGREVREPLGTRKQDEPNPGNRRTTESEELLRLAQGTWERQVTETPDPTDRMVKEIEGNTEVFSIYKGDTLTYQQVVDFDIDVRDGVAVFTMRNMRVTAGPQKGHEGSGQFSYTFQIRDDKWIEAQGLMDGDGAAPKLSIYERVDPESRSSQRAAEETVEERDDQHVETEVESNARKSPRAEDDVLRFSETREVVLSMSSMDYMLDLDTGKTMDNPATVGRPEESQMDVHTDQVQPFHYPRQLIGRRLDGIEVNASDWDASAAQVRRALSGDGAGTLNKMDLGPEKTRTYFFKTRDGAMGVLQLLEIVEEPKGIRIRYKTVQAPAAVTPAPAGERLDSDQSAAPAYTPSAKGRSGAVSSPQHDAIIVINAAAKGVNGPSCRSDMAPKGKSKCGPNSSLTELSWEFTEHRDGKDYYRFAWTLTSNGEMRNGKGLTVGFDGSSSATVIDAEHHIVIQKGPLDRDAKHHIVIQDDFLDRDAETAKQSVSELPFDKSRLPRTAENYRHSRAVYGSVVSGGAIIEGIDEDKILLTTADFIVVGGGPGRVSFKGTVDAAHELMVRIERDGKPLEWRSSGRSDMFEVVVEASDKVPLDGGKTGNGFVVTSKVGTTAVGSGADVTNVHLAGDLAGAFTIRAKADLVTNAGAVTFADVALDGGEKLPVTFRLMPKTK